MGVYVVSVGAEEWFDLEEDGWGQVAAGINAELGRRGRLPYMDVPPATDFAAGSGQDFEEKLSRPMTGFFALCRTYLSREESETLCGWSVLVPISLDEAIWLPIESGDYDSPVVGAPQVLPLAEKLAAAIELPPETPGTCDNLDLSMWFRDQAGEWVATRTGLWSADLDAAYYVALFLRAAQHSIRRGCPVVFT
ncbi:MULTISPECIES: hypothetical protein [unclassified Streptomyces]|uniref:hypothetical protein n=1 Tax=unclassified Streptomyces TaxID=2593676 RepID=UPI0004BDAB4D|nr:MULTISPECIES: hypothetical protein [unclassified Streptomyces]